jgi:ribosomal protein L37AE/L43A
MEMMGKTFDDIVDILFDGEKEDMEHLTCPECGGNISYRVYKGSMRVVCDSCHSSVSMGKIAYTPNCISHFGENHTFKTFVYA